MKKIFTLLTVVLFSTVSAFAGYGILVNGTTYYDGTMVDEFEGFTQYLAHVPVQAGDQVQLCDFDNKATWAVTLNDASTDGFTLNNDHYDVTVDGCYDFYIKLKYQQDQLYIGPGSNCGEGVPYDGGTVTPPTPQPGGAKDYFLKGWRGPTEGDITVPTAEEMFEGGILNYAFEGDGNGLGYFFILVCDAGQVVGKCYMAQEFATGHCTLYDQESTGYYEKLGVPAPSATFYLYDNGDGTLELSTEPLAGKTLVGGTEAVENTEVEAPVRKTIREGRLVIIRGEKAYDATGREL